MSRVSYRENTSDGDGGGWETTYRHARVRELFDAFPSEKIT